ncbi:alcohol dehydrogenase catalytic domain-containing protein [bacterium]|nr:alcohol dehydrogenase catalytic domain-containing protein [bacterium]
MKQMRMLVQTAPGKLEIQQVACPQPGPGEILMRVHYCGICGTDLMNYRGQYVWGRDSFPKFPGHEASGVVEALGEGSITSRSGIESCRNARSAAESANGAKPAITVCAGTA